MLLEGVYLPSVLLGRHLVEVSGCHHQVSLDLSYLAGYSFQTNRYGLTIDNIVGYELVLPNGTVMNLTPENDDLWFGLRVRRQARRKLISH